MHPNIHQQQILRIVNWLKKKTAIPPQQCFRDFGKEEPLLFDHFHSLWKPMYRKRE